MNTPSCTRLHIVEGTDVEHYISENLLDKLSEMLSRNRQCDSVRAPLNQTQRGMLTTGHNTSSTAILGNSCTWRQQNLQSVHFVGVENNKLGREHNPELDTTSAHVPDGNICLSRCSRYSDSEIEIVG